MRSLVNKTNNRELVSSYLPVPTAKLLYRLWSNLVLAYYIKLAAAEWI